MAYYKKHVFVCTNQKVPGKKCCHDGGGEMAFEHLKGKLLDLELHGPDKIRVSKSGCLGRCSSGPCIVVYPEGTWYTYHNSQDLDRIIDEHLIKEESVDDLLIEKL